MQANPIPIPHSTRLDALAPHSLWLFRLNAKIAELTAGGADIINLGLGNPDQPTAPGVVQAGQAALADPANHRYPEHTGLSQFNEAVAEYYERNFGVPGLDPQSEIVPTTGSQEALFNFTMGLTSPGDIVLSGDPGYPIHVSGPALAGAAPEYVRLDPERGYAPDFESVADEVADRAAMMFLCYPNNPTGAIGTAAVFGPAIEFARKHDVFIVHDFAYGDLGLDGYRPQSFLSFPGAADVGVELYSMTKGHNMAGWRIGTAVGRADAIERYLDVKTEVDLGTFSAVQVAAAHAMSASCDGEVEARREMYARRRDLVCDGLESAGIRVTRQRATL